MLKTSPILSASANASPRGFRHAPSRSSQESTSRPAAVAPSPKPQPQPRRQPSSDVSMTSAPAAAAAAAAAPAAAIAVESRHPSHPTSSAAAAQHEPPPASTGSNAQTQDTQSPNKRRNQVSPAADARGPPGASPETAAASTTKRVKPDVRPPKVLPQRYELCSVEDMVELIAHMLGELIATNDAIQISSGGLTRFHSRTPPGISVRDYLHRLARHATLPPPLLLAMVYYIDRLCALYQEFTINTLTVHRFLITAATVAAKGLSDSFWNNTTYARVGGVRVAELKLLELEFLYRVDWKIVPNPEVLVAYYQGLVQRAPDYTLESDGTTSDDEIDEDEDDDDDGQ